MLFGAHVSVAAGYESALEYARSVGCECIQIFAKSPRQWRGPEIDAEKAAAFAAARREVGFGPVFTHTAYLINLATDDSDLWEKSVIALADEIRRGASLDAAGVVTHIGNDPAGDPDAAARRVGLAVRKAFELAGERSQGTRLLLENTAGAGRTFGADFEELSACVAESDMPSDRLGVCIDTCHAFAFGYPLDTAAGWAEFISGVVRCCGIDRLGLVHANDCLFERGSRRDRHAWLGDGFIGPSGFEAMVCVPQLENVCACVEMSGEVPEKDAENLRRLRLWREECGVSQNLR